MGRLGSLFGIKNAVDSFFETADRARPLISFGAGAALKWRLDLMYSKGFKVACICDNDKNKQGKWIYGLEICSLEESIIKFPEALYILSTALYRDEIIMQLLQYVEPKNVCTIDFDCGSRYFSGTQFSEYLESHLYEFEELYNNLADDQSRDVLYNVAKGLLSGSRDDFERICTGNQYLYDGLMKLNPNDTYIDCGAYDGDTIIKFCAAAKNSGYKRIIAFEPDNENYDTLKGVIARHGIKNVEIINAGTWNVSGELQFSGGGMSHSVIPSCNKSLFSQNITHAIPVVTIDSVLKGESADVIKMDIEGAETNSLLGAEETIRKFKPRIAVCVYHNMEDYIKIPQLLRSFVPDYKLYLAHHSINSDETVLYATVK